MKIDVVEYARGYIERYNEICHELSTLGDIGTLFSEPIAMASILECTDGTVIVYVTEKTAIAAGQKPGIYYFPQLTETVGEYLQSGSGNSIKVIVPQKVTLNNMGPEIHTPKIPEDLPINRLRGGINPEVLASWDATQDRLIGMGVSPTIRYESGEPVAALPTRTHIFSPIFPLPKNKQTLQYVFPFLDVLWGKDSLDLKYESGKKWAEADLEVLSLGILAGIPQEALSEDPFEAVAQHIEKTCDAFLSLINDPSTIEKQVQDFIEKDSNNFLIFPHNKAIYCRRPIGGSRFIPDFIIHKPGGDYHFVEIESPNVPIYQPKGQEQSSHFTHSIQQVEDWLRFIDENLDYVRRENNLTDIYKPTGQVVIGRNSDLNEKSEQRFKFKKVESSRIKFMTYDMLIEEARHYATSLRTMRNKI